MNRVMGAAGLALACLTYLTGDAVRAAETAALSAQELGSAARKIESSPQFQKAAARQRDQRMFLVAAARYGAEGGKESPESPEIIELLYYKYEGGLTIRATLDVKRATVLEVQALAAYPAPLAREEREEAVRLARALDPSARALLAASQPEEVEVEMLAPVVADPNDARYGHRLALLTLHRKVGAGPAVMLEVDLTRGSVRPLHGGAGDAVAGDAVGARTPGERP